MKAFQSNEILSPRHTLKGLGIISLFAEVIQTSLVGQ